MARKCLEEKAGSVQMIRVKISVIVPAFNEEKLLSESLRHIQTALSVFARCGWSWELIVCDNNSTDHTAEIARAAGATVVFERQNQIARARNTGAAAATGDWLIFVDADSHPSAGLFEAVVAEITSGKCLAGGSTVRLEGSHPMADLVVMLWNWTSRLTRWLAGSFIFCEAATFREIGGFSQELFATEEIDLSKRLKARARQIGKRIAILHRHPLVTSDRKVHLYSLREHGRFMVRLLLGRGKILANREACHTWYDGRR